MKVRLAEDAVEEVREVHWLSRGGQSFEVPVPFQVHQISDRSSVRRAYSNSAWEEVTLEASNELSQYLHSHHRAEFAMWNQVTRKARDFLEKEVDGRIREAGKVFGFGQPFVDCVKWDILGALMERSYAACDPPLFFVHLFDVYSAGHFPCGWDGPWPSGSLLVF